MTYIHTLLPPTEEVGKRRSLESWIAATMVSASLPVALALSMVGGLSTAFGALLVVLFPTPNIKRLGLLQGLAAGLMLTISFMDLLHNAINAIGFSKANFWFFGGVIMLAGIVTFIPEPSILPQSSQNDKRRKERRNDSSPSKDLTKRRHKQVLFSGIITAVGISLHNFPEGMAVFLGSMKGLRVGISLALAIALHNIPEVSTILCSPVGSHDALQSPLFHVWCSKNFYYRGFSYASLMVERRLKFVKEFWSPSRHSVF
ncbi:hypothetical protein O6H91_Y337500 [Diphasiastrum complanatum]|nr:hypothetical protein O6H91_Y337500 [Diphasiastrum complanatum]